MTRDQMAAIQYAIRSDEYTAQANDRAVWAYEAAAFDDFEWAIRAMEMSDHWAKSAEWARAMAHGCATGDFSEARKVHAV